jgi:hypothetical protein
MGYNFAIGIIEIGQLDSELLMKNKSQKKIVYGPVMHSCGAEKMQQNNGK